MFRRDFLKRVDCSFLNGGLGGSAGAGSGEGSAGGAEPVLGGTSRADGKELAVPLPINSPAKWFPEGAADCCH